MKQTAMQEVNKMFAESNPDEFYGWFWNNRDRLLEIDKEKIVEAHGDKLKKSKDVGNYEYWVSGEDYYTKTFTK
jgi:hypothetical protein